MLISGYRKLKVQSSRSDATSFVAAKRSFAYLVASQEDTKQLTAENYLLQRKNDLLKQIISVMNTSTKLDNILSYILDLCTMITTSEASFMLLKEKQGSDFLSLRAVSGLNKKKLIGKEWEVGKGIAGEVYCSGKERVVNDISKDSSFAPEIINFLELEKSITSLMAIPLNCEGRLLGTIEIINKKDNLKYTNDDFELCNILAEQAASVVGQEASFRSIEAKIKRFNLLIDVSKEITSITDLHVLLSKIMESAKIVMQADASSLFLLDEKANELYIETAHGEAGEKIRILRLPVGKGIAGWVAQKGQPLLIPDAYEDPRFNREFDLKTGYRTKSILCVPLEYKKKIKGVVQIINALNKETFEEEDIGYMNALAGQAAIAIENARFLQSNKELFMNMVTALVKIIDSKYKFFNGHSVRVAKYSVAIGQQLGLPPDTIEKIQIAAFVHDIGRLQIPESILLKPGPLTPEEMNIVKQQPVIGASILQGIKMLDYVVPAILHHMENFDGAGYPKGLKGDQIPLISRILAVANTYDALTSPRPPRQPLTPEVAKGRVSAATGSQFDPIIVQAFAKAFAAGLLK